MSMYGSSLHEDDPYSDVSPSFLNFNITISIITATIAIPGNLLLIIIFCTSKQLRDLNNIAITILSATDLLRSCIVMTTKIHNQLHRISDMDSYGFHCGLTAVTSSFSFVFCPLMLAFIAFVRYYKIVPHSGKHFKLTDRGFYKIVVVLLLTTTLFAALPYMHVGAYAFSHIHGVCFVDWTHRNANFRILFYLLAFFIAFPVLATSYVMLSVALQQNNRRLMRHFKSKVVAVPVVVDVAKEQDVVLLGQPVANGEGTHGNRESEVTYDAAVLNDRQSTSGVSSFAHKGSNGNADVCSNDSNGKDHLHQDQGSIEDDRHNNDMLKNDGKVDVPIRTSLIDENEDNLPHGSYAENKGNSTAMKASTSSANRQSGSDRTSVNMSPRLTTTDAPGASWRKNKAVKEHTDTEDATQDASPMLPRHSPRIKNLIKKRTKAIKLQLEHRHDKHKHDNRVTKLLVAIFIAYLVCWLPGTILNVIALFKMELLHQQVPTNFWFYLIVTLEELKSALDPLIYGLGNQKYRTAFVKLLRKARSAICRPGIG